MELMNYIHKLFDATPKERDTIPRVHKSLQRAAPPRGRAEEAQAEARQRLNAYSSTGATGVLILAMRGRG